MAKLKNLATCTPSEFLRQTNLIRKEVSKWLTATDILNIRKRVPAIPEGATEEERKKALQEQTRKNFDAILDSVLEEHPDETLRVLALASFVDPKDVDKHSVIEYIASFNELLQNEEVISFFTSLADWGQIFGSEE